MIVNGIKALYQESKQDTGCNGRTDDARHVRAHGMHQQIVGRVVFQADNLRDAGRVGHGGYAGITDERVDLVALLQEEVEYLHEEYAGGCGDDERQGTKDEDLDGIKRQELRSLGGGTHGQTQQDPEGTRKHVSNRPTMGKMTFSVCDTTRGGFMRMRRSCLVVSRRMMGGWITGTNAMYE